MPEHRHDVRQLLLSLKHHRGKTMPHLVGAGHTMTLLGDGRVLVVGGPGGPGSEAFSDSAELWDPATETFAPTGPLSDARAQHTATLLPDGRVLIIGGTDGNGALASAELWHPATGLFEPAGALDTGRAFHTATLLPDGRVLVTGGWDWATEPALASSEIWDPETQTFGSTGSLLQLRELHTATLLHDGRVLIVGGRSRIACDDTSTVGAELWDSNSGSFRPAVNLEEARFEHTANLLPDGRVLVIGGMDPATEEGGPTMAEVWDPELESFSSAGVMEGPTAMHTATLLPDGRVLVVGSLYVDEELISMAQTWEPVEG